jgi:hypothetical protein
MAIAKTRIKRFLVQGLGPEVVCTLVGVIIGIITYRDQVAASSTLTANLVDWIININAGAVAHQLSWLIVIKSFKTRTWEEPSTFRAIWKPTLLGMVLTFVFVFLLNKGYTLSRETIVMMFFQVVAICFIVHVFLFQFKFYDISNKLLGLEYGVAVNPGTAGQTEKNEDFLPLTVNERIVKVNLDLVSHIKVEDHYCTVVYLQDSGWRQWTVYGKLTTFENDYPSRLIRINRSVLVNPNQVIKVEKSAGKHLITMKGEPAVPYPLSSNQKHLLDRIVPQIV